MELIPFKTPRLLKTIFPKLLWNIENKDEKALYLTFDDGPIPKVTPFVLDCLDDYDAKATFFCIGENVAKHPSVFKNVLSRGHVVGNHTFHHLNGRNYSTKVYLEDVNKCQSLLKLKGVESSLFRPPYGRMRMKQRNILRNKYQIVMWDVLTKDYSPAVSKEKCLSESIKGSEPGSIVLFHDSIKAQKNMAYSLPRYLKYFKDMGYQFKSL